MLTSEEIEGWDYDTPQVAALARYGRTKVETIGRDFDALRDAIKAHDTFATEAAWDRCERWLGLVTTQQPEISCPTCHALVRIRSSHPGP